MAHNLNNLLLPILSLSRRAMNELPEEDQRQYLEKVVQAGERAKNLVVKSSPPAARKKSGPG